MLETYIYEGQSVEPDLDQQVIQNFNKLQGLVSVFDQDVHEAYVQQSVEFSALTVATSAISSQFIHPASISSTSCIISTNSPIVLQTVTQPILRTNTYVPPISSHITQPNMASCYSPLVLPRRFHPMPQDYQTIIP